MVIGMEIRIVNVQILGLFSNETLRNRPRTIIQDSDFHFNDRSESHVSKKNVSRNGLYVTPKQSIQHAHGSHI